MTRYYSQKYHKEYKYAMNCVDAIYYTEPSKVKPIRLIFSGGLYDGRINTLKKFSNLLNKMNQSEIIVLMDIHTSKVEKKRYKKFNWNSVDNRVKLTYFLVTKNMFFYFYCLSFFQKIKLYTLVYKEVKMNNIIISIIIPIYNMGNKIENMLNDLLNQTFSEFEIILVDDGSTDNSLDVLLEYAKKNSKIQVFHTNNYGAGPARNYGINKSKGEYLYFPDADDSLEKDALEIIVKEVQSNKYDLIVFGYKKINQNKKIVLEKKYEVKEFDGDFIRNNYKDFLNMDAKFGIQGAPWNKIFKRSIIQKYDIKFPSLRRHQDEGFIARYVNFIENAKFISDVLYIYKLNTTIDEWIKYPLDYINSVIGLYEIKKDTICTWTNNSMVNQLVSKEYICNMIKSFELIFSPKANEKSFLKAYKELKKNINKAEFEKIEVHNFDKQRYQKVIFKISKNKHFLIVFILIKIKLILQINFKRVLKL